MCEVEVQGGFQDVAGDEEGLVATPNPSGDPSGSFANGTGHGQNVYYPHAMGGVPFSNDGSQYARGASDPSWSSRAHQSPPFGAVNVPSPQPQHPSIPLIRSNSSRSSHNGSPASFLRQSHSALPSNVFETNVTSMSAPSHKQQFDHAALYPPEMGMDDGSGSIGPGPVRRHRSMTPSLMRDGPETIRRPLTAASGDFAGSGSGTPSGPRGYHPYAMSAQSSPSVYPIPLDYQDPPSSGGQMQDHMRAMMVGESREVPTDMYAPHTTAPGGFGDIYRTDSPTPFQGGEFGGTTAQQGGLVSESTMYGLSGMDGQHTQFVGQDGAEGSAYYVPTHHVTM
jgi:transcription factor STE12